MMTAALLPPSSRIVLANLLWTSVEILFPILVDPVKDTS